MATKRIRIDEASARKAKKKAGQPGVRPKFGEVELREMVPVSHRIQPMPEHQPAQCQTVRPEIGFLHPSRFLAVHAEKSAYERSHQFIGLGNYCRCRPVEGVVEVENPCLNLAEANRILFSKFMHSREIGLVEAICKLKTSEADDRQDSPLMPSAGKCVTSNLSQSRTCPDSVTSSDRGKGVADIAGRDGVIFVSCGVKQPGARANPAFWMSLSHYSGWMVWMSWPR